MSNLGFVRLNLMLESCVPIKYLNICFRAFQCSQQRLSINLVSVPITCTKLARVMTILCTKEPMVDVYVTNFIWSPSRFDTRQSFRESLMLENSGVIANLAKYMLNLSKRFYVINLREVHVSSGSMPCDFHHENALHGPR